MPSTDPSEGFSGLQQWSGPVIFDRLFAAYRELTSDFAVAHALTRLHAQVWRALIRGDMAGFEELRETLVGALGDCFLTLDHLAEVDGEIMIELLEVVLSRYQRSQRTAKAYHLALMELGGRLRPARAAAEAPHVSELPTLLAASIGAAPRRDERARRASYADHSPCAERLTFADSFTAAAHAGPQAS